MELKYQSHHRNCSECQLEHLHTTDEILAYRLVKDMAPSNEDFLPPAILKPTRSFKSAKQRCSGYALSFFTSAENARSMQKKLCKQLKFFKNMKCIAETKVTAADGKVSAADKNGHFDLHEEKHADMANSIVACLPVGSS